MGHHYITERIGSKDKLHVSHFTTMQEMINAQNLILTFQQNIFPFQQIVLHFQPNITESVCCKYENAIIEFQPKVITSSQSHNIGSELNIWWTINTSVNIPSQ